MPDKTPKRPVSAEGLQSAAATPSRRREPDAHCVATEGRDQALPTSRDSDEAADRHFADRYDVVPIAHFSLGREGSIRHINLAGAELPGTASAQAMGRPFTDFVATESHPAFESFFQEVFDRGATGDCDVAIKQDGHTLRYVLMKAIAAEDGHGCDGVMVDITHHKRHEHREHLRTVVLDLVAREVPLHDVLTAITSQLECYLPHLLFSVVLLDKEGRRVRYSEAHNPLSLYVMASDISEMGLGVSTGKKPKPRSGSDRAADQGLVVPSEFCRDCLRMADRSRPDGCQSETIRGKTGDVLGVLMIYRKCCLEGLARYETDLIRLAVDLARIAIEHWHVHAKLQLASLVYRSIGEAVMVADAQNRIVAINPVFTRLSGFAPHEAIGQHTNLLKSGRNSREFYQAMWHALKTVGHWEGEIWNRRKNGEEYAEWLTISTIYADDGSVQGRVGMFSDITDQKRAEAIIWRQANFDSLTQLPNRRLFYDRLEQEIRKAHRGSHHFAVLFIDLDRFKEVNDTLGHDVGDRLLTLAAQRIVPCVRESDTVARLGGDEFVLVLSEVADTGQVNRVADAILGALSDPFELGDETVYITASVGITFYPNDAADVEGLLKSADQAMYVAKNEGRNRYSRFTRALQEKALARQQLVKDLHAAVAGNQFSLAFQPIVDLASGDIVKAEALLRWEHPLRGTISPAQFIPIAEETGLINPIGDWVLRESVRQLRDWSSWYPASLQISVNTSPVQFLADDKYHQVWLDHLQDQGVSAHAIVVEITESLLLNADTPIVDKLLKFRDAGIQVAIDDFGTGYSALSYLQKFHIDYLKIDQSFVHDLESNPSNIALSEAIVVMAHKLGLQVIAEGVETEAQRDLLAGIGCDFGQGYLFSRPLPAAGFEELLKLTLAGERRCGDGR